jgi:hypothetical protein
MATISTPECNSILHGYKPAEGSFFSFLVYLLPLISLSSNLICNAVVEKNVSEWTDYLYHCFLSYSYGDKS